MIQRDYLVRQVQQLTQMLVRLVFRKRERRYDEALRDIQKAGELFLGLDVHAVQVLTPESVRQALRVRTADDAALTGLVAELLCHQGDCFAETGRPADAHASYQLALHLYLDAFTAAPDVRPAGLLGRIDDLLDTLEPFDLPPETARLLFRYFDATRRYARAEDLLFHLADTQPSRALYDEGIAFFERLLHTSYRYLHAGNLPYEEVREGLTAFREKFPALPS